MRITRFMLFALLLVTVFAASGSTFAANVTVNCAGGPGDFPSINAALAALDLVGPHTIQVTAGPCIENVVLTDRQRILITAAPFGGVFIQSNNNAPAMVIERSTGIILELLGFSDSGAGLLINEISEVNAFGCTVENNLRAGISLLGSTLHFNGLVQNNGGPGIAASNSLLTIDGNTSIQNNARAGLTLTTATAQFDGTPGTNFITGNRNGINVVANSTLIMTGGNTIQNNTFSGINATASYIELDGGDAPNIIDNHSFIGINLTGSKLLLSGPNVISNNGFGKADFHAAIRVDDDSLLISSGVGDISITNNTGPGIEATMGSSIDLTGTIITKNTEDGVRLISNSRTGIFGTNTSVISGNGGSSIVCDKTSLFWGDATGLKDIKCENVGHDGRASGNIRGPKIKE